MSTHPLVLLACRSSETEVLRGLVPAGAAIVTADCKERAVERIREGVDAVVCSLDFDDSRMLELVREAHAQRPELPVLCCRVFGTTISDISLRAAATAAFSMGVAAFLDLASPGLAGDVAEFVSALVRLLG
jgi:DNA-binding NtrC family response regulator